MLDVGLVEKEERGKIIRGKMISEAEFLGEAFWLSVFWLLRIHGFALRLWRAAEAGEAKFG